jgi:hypothetical protein
MSIHVGFMWASLQELKELQRLLHSKESIRIYECSGKK